MPRDFDIDDDVGLGAGGKDDEFLSITTREVKKHDSIASMDLEQELLDRYYDAQMQLKESSGTTLAQRAQTMGIINSILNNIVKTQTDVYNMQRLKKMEAAVIETVKHLDPAIKDRFFEKFHEALASND